MTTTWSSESHGTGEYADVNGIRLYVETHGTGKPMILLHGGLGSGEMFGPILPALTEHHQVILPDLQGHGRTADIDRPLDIRTMADDIAVLIDHLGLDRPDVVGYSLGGGVALQTAMRHPEKVGRRGAASPRMPAHRRCRPCWWPPMRTWRLRAITSTRSRCSMVDSATAAGPVRTGRRAATRWPSCPG